MNLRSLSRETECVNPASADKCISIFMLVLYCDVGFDCLLSIRPPGCRAAGAGASAGDGQDRGSSGHAPHRPWER